MNNGKPYKWVVLLLFIAALAMRLIGLGAHSFWFDEGLEIDRALSEWSQILLLSAGPDPPLFRLIIAPLVRVSNSEFILRLPSALLGAGSVPLLYAWLRLLGRPQLGLWAALLLAVAPAGIYYSQEVSQYALVLFLTVALLYAAELVVRVGRVRHWVLLTVTGVLSLLAYYGLGAVLLVISLRLAWQTWSGRSRERLLGFAGYHLALGLTFAAVVYFYLVTQYEYVSQRSLQQAPFSSVPWRDLLRTVDDALYRGFLRFLTAPFSEAVPPAIPGLFGLLALAGAVVLWRRFPRNRSLLAMPPLIVITFYLAAGFGYYHFGYRYGLPLLPFFVLFMAATLWELARHWRLGAVGATLLLAVVWVAFWPNLRLLPNPWMDLPREELRPVLTYVERNAGADDFVYVYYGAVPAYKAYRPDPDSRTALGSWLRGAPLEEQLAEIRETSACAERLWLVFSHIYGDEETALVRGLSQGVPRYRQVDALRTENAAGFLLERRGECQGAASPG